jgi:hypothetical protein
MVAPLRREAFDDGLDGSVTILKAETTNPNRTAPCSILGTSTHCATYKKALLPLCAIQTGHVFGMAVVKCCESQ